MRRLFLMAHSVRIRCALVLSTTVQSCMTKRINWKGFMGIEYTPAGERITRICFHLAINKNLDGSGDDNLKRCEFTLAPTESGEEIGSLWCDITPDFITITMMVAGAAHQAKSLKLDAILSGLLEAQSLERGAAGVAFEGDFMGLMKRVVDGANNIEHRRLVYKVSEVTGPIEITHYFPSVKLEDIMRVSSRAS